MLAAFLRIHIDIDAGPANIVKHPSKSESKHPSIRKYVTLIKKAKKWDN